MRSRGHGPGAGQERGHSPRERSDALLWRVRHQWHHPHRSNLSRSPPFIHSSLDANGGSDYSGPEVPGLRCLGDGRVEMDTNPVERAIRSIALNRKNTLSADSVGGARHVAVAMTLIQTATLNGIEPMAYLTDVLQRIVSGQTKTHELHTMLLWA